MEENRWSSETEKLLSILQQESQMASACTEPGSIALAAAEARKLTSEAAKQISVILSPGVMKNALAVGLPGTETKGPGMAAALGAAGGNPEHGLNILGMIKPEYIAIAQNLIDSGKVKVDYDPNRTGIYISVTVFSENHTATVLIRDCHSVITERYLDSVKLSLESRQSRPISMLELRGNSFYELVGIALALKEEDLEFLLEGAFQTYKLAEKSVFLNAAAEQVKQKNGLEEKQPDDSLLDRIAMLVIAAVSGRMNGIQIPVITAGGSGNQGIITSVALIAFSEKYSVSKLNQARALALANTINLFIKAYSGEISAYCGAVSAAAGIAGAVSWLLGGSYQQIENSIQTVIGTIYGLFCDGAKTGCAYKCATSAVTGVIFGKLSVADIYLEGCVGLVGDSLEDTLAGLEQIQNASRPIDELLVKLASRVISNSENCCETI